jgi:hypothetical protein
MAEPFQQLPADRTLWRTLGGQCVKAVGPLLLDCPPHSEAAPAAAADGSGVGSEPEGAVAATGAAEEEASGAGGGRRGGGGKRRGRGREERCTYVVADHRLYKAVAALGRCLVAEAEAAGDACTPQVVRELMPRRSAEEEARGRRRRLVR